MADPVASIALELQRVINRLLFLEKRTILEHGGVKLHPSEIHLMLVVHEDGPVNVTRAARRLAVTKGAVSQTLTRLVRKGMLSRDRDPDHGSELRITLTAAGQLALAQFELDRAPLRQAHATYLASLSARDAQVIRSFLTEMERFLGGLE